MSQPIFEGLRTVFARIDRDTSIRPTLVSSYSGLNSKLDRTGRSATIYEAPEIDPALTADLAGYSNSIIHSYTDGLSFNRDGRTRVKDSLKSVFDSVIGKQFKKKKALVDYMASDITQILKAFPNHYLVSAVVRINAEHGGQEWHTADGSSDDVIITRTFAGPSTEFKKNEQGGVVVPRPGSITAYTVKTEHRGPQYEIETTRVTVALRLATSIQYDTGEGHKVRSGLRSCP